MTAIWTRVLGVSLVALLGLVSCGNDPEPPSNEGAVAQDDEEDEGEGPSAELYCELVEELDDAGDDFFKELEDDEDASMKDYEKAERDFFREYESEMDELIAAGPDEIADDVRTIVASIKSRAGLGPKVPQGEASAAEKRVQRYEKQNC